MRKKYFGGKYQSYKALCVRERMRARSGKQTIKFLIMLFFSRAGYEKLKGAVGRQRFVERGKLNFIYTLNLSLFARQSCELFPKIYSLKQTMSESKRCAARICRNLRITFVLMPEPLLCECSYLIPFIKKSMEFHLKESVHPSHCIVDVCWCSMEAQFIQFHGGKEPSVDEAYQNV